MTKEKSKQSFYAEDLAWLKETCPSEEKVMLTVCTGCQKTMNAWLMSWRLQTTNCGKWMITRKD